MIDQDAHQALLTALRWQVELGADEAIADVPSNRFEDPHAAPAVPATGTMAAAPRAPDGANRPASDARPGPGQNSLAASAQSLDALAKMLADWDGSPLCDGARRCVFADGMAGARVMVIGEAPGSEEDRLGKPFVGRAGQLLDRMLSAIGLSRSAPDPGNAVYITNILPWRPPGNRTPSDAEAALFLPFVERHIALADPDIVLSMGNTPTKALLNTATGIKRMRGTWSRHAATGKPVLATFHPAYLLRQPADKRLAWHDLLSLRRALDDGVPLP